MLNQSVNKNIDIESHPIQDLVTQSDDIQLETEVQFGQYLGSELVEAKWWNPFSWGGVTKKELRNAHLEA